MNSSKLIDYEDFNVIKEAFVNKTFKATLPDITKSNLSRIDIIKKTLALLFTLAELSNNYDDQPNLLLFKEAAMIIIISVIKPLAKDLLQAEIDNANEVSIDYEIIELKACNLSKWWCNYFCLIDIVKKVKKNCLNWEGSAYDWFTKEEFSLIQDSLKALEPHLHWKILLLQTICRRETLLIGMIEPKTYEEYFKIIHSYYTDIIKVEYSNAKSNI